VNPDAPIVCCTAEILANIALRQGSDAAVDQVVMDEFHFYGDPERGWAWQVPLLLLTGVQFLLMSATLGDVSTIAADLARRTGAPSRSHRRRAPRAAAFLLRATARARSADDAPRRARSARVHRAFRAGGGPRTGAGAGIAHLTTRAQRDEIAEAIGAFRFTTGFGKTLSRLVRAGIGVHHAGMLPRYRRLVETLAQRGCSRSSAAPTRSASASTCRSAPS
jgi:superfamily II RNA helicase